MAATVADTREANNMARAIVLSQATENLQQIYSSTFSVASGNVLNIPPRNVGLIKGFWIFIEGTIANTGATNPAVITPLGVSNLISRFLFTDLQNNTRINTSGAHIAMLDTVKLRRPFDIAGDLLVNAAAGNPTQLPVSFLNSPYVTSGNTTAATRSIAVSPATSPVTMAYYLPLAYAPDDLRGAIYANVVNATMNLQITVNPTPLLNATDTTLAVYSGNTTGGWTGNTTVTVYQDYLDQLPIGSKGPVLPWLDLSTIYELKDTTVTGISANQDFPIPFSNFRDFLSTFALYANAGTGDSGGDYVNYWALQTANYTNIWKISSWLAQAKVRNLLGYALPANLSYFEFRRRPISTIQYGNTEIVLNANNVQTNAQIIMWYESFALQNIISGAASLPGG